MNKTIIHSLVLGLSAGTLAACGGGSSDATNSPTLLANGEACATAWNAATVYANAGTKVSRLGRNYTNNWWTQGEDPSTNSGAAGSGMPWLPGYTCGSTPTPAPTPAPTPTPTPAPTPTPTPAPTPACTYSTWTAGVNYPLGTVVKYTNGNFYKEVNAGTNGSDGTDPTVSTWYWSPTTCGATPTPAPTPTPTPTPAPTPTPTTIFKHPGVLVNKAQLDFVKAKIQANVEPFASAYRAAQNSSLGSLSYAIEGPPSDHVIDCGPVSNPDHGCSWEKSDASAAYTQALLWYFSGNDAYAKKAIAIMNAYARGLTGGHTNANAPLQAAWAAENWPAAAEIIRYTYTGWAASDVKAFQNMLTTQYQPSVSGTGGNGGNGNWKLSMTDAMMGIAVFNENKSLFDTAVSTWKKWVPAYYYNYSQDGGAPVTFSGGPGGWNGQTVFNSSTSGVTQETCRDLQHVGLGMAATFNAAETAYIQGTDLYGLMQTRLVTSLEYTARMLQGVTNTSESASFKVPAGFPGLCDGTYSPVLKGTMERAYNAYHTRKGVSMPETLKHLVNDVRPKAQPNDQHDVIWETLTHGGNPN